MALSVGLIGAALLCLWTTAGARAGDRIYWADRTGGGVPPVAFANLDGTGGSDLDITGATAGYSEGVTIDAAAGRVYWANGGGNRISFANLDGGGGGDLATPGATVNSPNGVAVDPLAARIYWANYVPNKISFANLDGSGGGDLNTGAATVSSPLGTAVDHAGGRIYWANNSGSTAISFANLDGSGGGDLVTTGGTVSSPWGVALDLGAGKVYWANSGSSPGISFANLDGSGGGDLVTTGAAITSPNGVAIDPPAGRIYATSGAGGPNSVALANLDGSGGTNLNVAGTSAANPNFAALLEHPSGAGSPTITGGSAPGSVLSCSRGSWEPDLLGSFLYRAPRSFSHQWRVDGADLAGATSNSITAGSVGIYQCRETAENDAGSASQTSVPAGVFKVRKAKLNKRKGTARLPVRVPGPGDLKLAGKGVMKQRPDARVGITNVFGRPVTEAGTVRLSVKPKGKTKRKLNRASKVKVVVRVTYTPTGGTPGNQAKKIKLKKNLRR